MGKTSREIEYRRGCQDLEFWCIKLKIAFVPPDWYAQQADSYISLEFKGEVWVRGVVFLSLHCTDGI